MAYQLREPIHRLREEYGLDVASIHGTPMRDLCAKEGWKRCLSVLKDAQSKVTGDREREPFADPSIRDVFDRLDDQDYRGPLVVELDPPYRTASVVDETVDYLRERR